MLVRSPRPRHPTPIEALEFDTPVPGWAINRRVDIDLDDTRSEMDVDIRPRTRCCGSRFERGARNGSSRTRHCCFRRVLRRLDDRPLRIWRLRYRRRRATSNRHQHPSHQHHRNGDRDPPQPQRHPRTLPPHTRINQTAGTYALILETVKRTSGATPQGTATSSRQPPCGPPSSRSPPRVREVLERVGRGQPPRAGHPLGAWVPGGAAGGGGGLTAAARDARRFPRSRHAAMPRVPPAAASIGGSTAQPAHDPPHDGGTHPRYQLTPAASTVPVTIDSRFRSIAAVAPQMVSSSISKK